MTEPTEGELVLADGTRFAGALVGAAPETSRAGGRTLGEVVFNTAMTGYQEIMTDPSYAGQIVCLTYPLIGNYGISQGSSQSTDPHIRGLIIRQSCRRPNHWQSEETLEDFLQQHGLTGLAGVDTRALTRHLRQQGTMMGRLLPAGAEPGDLPAWDEAFSTRELVASVSTDEVRTLPGSGPRLTVVDYGVKRAILQALRRRDAHVTALPWDADEKQIAATRPDAVLLSNGPGDPAALKEPLQLIRRLTSRWPVFGICFGHQLLGLAFGGGCFKLKYGHRGGNHPVRHVASGRIFITSQNHGYALDRGGVDEAGFEVTHEHVHDGTVAGMRHRERPAASVQFHPEAAPGPTDFDALFDRWVAEVAS